MLESFLRGNHVGEAIFNISDQLGKLLLAYYLTDHRNKL